jgi:hypothetical protein
MGLYVRSLPGMVGLPGNGGDGALGGQGKGCFPYYTRSAGDDGKPGRIGEARIVNELVYFGRKGVSEINHLGDL